MGKRFSPEVKSLVKEMFLSLDKDGRKVFTYADIVREVQERFGVTIRRETIWGWADKLGWNALIRKAAALASRGGKVTEIEQVVDAQREKEREYDRHPVAKHERVATQVVDSLEIDKELLDRLIEARKGLINQHIRLARDLYREVKEAGGGLDQDYLKLCDTVNRVGKTLYDMITGVVGETADEKWPSVIIGSAEAAEEAGGPAGEETVDAPAIAEIEEG